jgi:N-acetylglucosaminyldiphosphoundecaprenol N-acetyl-beta-D-mannosaminyltransferase
MIDLGKQNILGIGINAVDYDAATDSIIKAAVEKQPYAVSALAVHGVMTGAMDQIHKRRLNNLDLVVPDGQPVRWAMKWLHGISLPDRVYGPELTLRVCEKAADRGLSVYLYGSQAQVLEKLQENLKEKYPGLKIAGAQPSLFRQITAHEQSEIAETIKKSGADIVLVGLGCPRQETWVFEYRDLLSMPMLAVGAAFDFHAGLLSQAPPWLQKRGLEWLYRLVKEPGRLWKRYAVTNSLFLIYIALQITKVKRLDLEETSIPVPRMRFG